MEGGGSLAELKSSADKAFELDDMPKALELRKLYLEKVINTPESSAKDKVDAYTDLAKV